MAKANLVLPNGTTVGIEGTTEEVAALLARYSANEPTSSVPTSKKHKSRKSRSGGSNTSSATRSDGPTSLITELTTEGYFKSKRSIGDIQKKLEERGHIYALTSISPVLTRLTRKRAIRRIKEKKVWTYVN